MTLSLHGLLIGDKGYTRKLLSHTVGVFLNTLLGREALQFERLVEI